MALIDKASLLFVPSVVAEGKAFNILPSGNRAPDSTDQNSGYDQTRADFDFDRGSNAAATRIDSNGVLQKYRENELLQSNQFDTTWTNVNSTETSGQSGYDGSSNAWLLTLTGGTATKLITQSTSTLSGVYNTSFYVKAGTHSIVQIGTSTQSNIFVCFDLSDGSVGSLSSNAIDAKATSIANGWYRIEVTFLATNATGISIAGVDSISATRFQSTSSTGNFYIQNAQLESGLVSTDYLDSTSVTGKAGVLVDLPRINYDANGENGSLLLEPSRQQLLPYSEWIGGWAIVNDATIDGVQSFTLGSTGARIQAGSIGSPSGDFVFYAVFDSADIGKTIKLSYYDATASTWVFGNDITIDSNGRAERLISTGSNVIGNVAFYGTSTSQSFTLKYCQFEAGSYPTSYIPNHGESGGVTRAADSCSVTDASDVIGQTEGTIFAEVKITDGKIDTSTDDLRVIELANDNGSTLINIQLQDTEILRFVRVSSTQSANTIIADSAITTGGTFKMAAAYKNNDLAFYINGEQIGTSSETFNLGNVQNIFIGESRTNILQLGDSIKQVALFNERLTNEELATLTTL